MREGNNAGAKIGCICLVRQVILVGYMKRKARMNKHDPRRNL
jgi:hypothetical protein